MTIQPPKQLSKTLQGLEKRPIPQLFDVDINHQPPTSFLNSIGSGKNVLAPPIHERVILSLDCEYVRIPGRKKLKVLSYQVCILKDDKKFTDIFYPTGGKRLKLKKYLDWAISGATKARVLTGKEEFFLFTAHFSRADLSLFADFFDGFYTDLSVLRKTFMSFKSSAYTITDEEIERHLSKEQKLNYWDRSRNKHTIYIQFVDTMTLSPGGKSLNDIAQTIGYEKLEFPEHLDISRMDLVLETDPAFFKAYAIRDAEIAAEYLAKMIKFVTCELFPQEDGKPGPLYNMPTTLGGMATRAIRISLGSRFGELFGVIPETHTEWDEKANRFITKTGWCYQPVSRAFSQFPVEAFHGGMNQAFVCGLTSQGNFEDWDLKSCYTTAMMGLRPLDFTSIKHTTDVADFTGDIYGLAYVKFRFPESVDKPMLAVRSDYGLIFPRSGETYITSLEIQVAVELGAEIEIVHGMIIPWASEDRIFQPFMQNVLGNRQKHPKGSLFERLWKEMGNSVYGKLAQGARRKTVYDLLSGKNKQMSKSDLTNVYFACYVTGLIRAVAGEQLNRLPKEVEVLNFITDGYLLKGTGDEIDLTGPASQLFQEFSKYIDPQSNSILECKHKSHQVIVGKTRMHVSVAGRYEGKPICAKGSQKVPKGLDEVEYMNDLYKNRTPGQVVEASNFTPVRTMMHNKQDMIMEHKQQRLNLEYDCKRRLVNPRMNSFPDGSEHIYCSTEPFNTLDEMLVYKSIFEAFRDSHCLKTMDDWYDWQDFLEFKMATRGKRGLKGIRSSDLLLVKAMVQCWSLNKSGFESGLVRAKDMFDWLVQEGIELFKKANSLSSIKRNPWKTDFSKCVPLTQRTDAMLKRILQQYPNFVYEDVFREQDLPKIEESLGGTHHG